MTVQRLEHSGIVVDDIHASLAGLGAHGGEMVPLAVLRARPGGDPSSNWRRRSADGCRVVGQEHVDRPRETGGEEGHDRQGTTVLLLTTTARKSGAKRPRR